MRRVDEKKRHVEWDFELDQCMFLGQYSIEGQVLILPIKGDGNANITVSESDIFVMFILLFFPFFRHFGGFSSKCVLSTFLPSFAIILSSP